MEASPLQAAHRERCECNVRRPTKIQRDSHYSVHGTRLPFGWTDALTTVNKLQAYSYDKAEGLDNLEERSRGVGLIAQDVLQIPELAFAVSGGGQHTDAITGEVKDIPYSLNYTDVLVHLIEAVKELDAKVTTLKSGLAGL